MSEAEFRFKKYITSKTFISSEVYISVKNSFSRRLFGSPIVAHPITIPEEFLGGNVVVVTKFNFQETFLGANVVVSEKFNVPEDFDCNSSDYLSRRVFGS